MKYDSHSSRPPRCGRRIAASGLTMAVMLLSVGVAHGLTHDPGTDRAGSTRLDMARAADVSSAPAGTVLGGFTAQRLPSFFQISKNGRTLVVGSIAVMMSCRSGGSFVLEDDFARLPIAANGQFHGKWTVPPTKQSGGTFSGAGSLAGRLNHQRSKLSGVWQVGETFIGADGTTEQCGSGLVRFTALQ